MDTAASADFLDDRMADDQTRICSKVLFVRGTKESAREVAVLDDVSDRQRSLRHQSFVCVAEDQHVGNDGVTNEIVHGRRCYHCSAHHPSQFNTSRTNTPADTKAIAPANGYLSSFARFLASSNKVTAVSALFLLDQFNFSAKSFSPSRDGTIVHVRTRRSHLPQMWWIHDGRKR